jgi:hypothetical protein
VETFHLIDKAVLCFGTFRNHIHELAFGFHFLLKCMKVL